MHILDFTALVHNYCQLRQLPIPAPNGVSFIIEQEDALPVILAWDEERDDIVLIVPLYAQAVALDTQEAHDILCAAFVGQGLNGAAISIDPNTGVLSLWRRLASEAASLERLTQDIQHITQAAQHVKL